jgi:hypothetical protein
MRDWKPLLALVVVSALLLFIVPWWVALGAFVGGYIALGRATLLIAIANVRDVTSLDTARARAVYLTSITGDWSKIETNELKVANANIWAEKGDSGKFKRELATVILTEKGKREGFSDYFPD